MAKKPTPAQAVGTERHRLIIELAPQSPHAAAAMSFGMDAGAPATLAALFTAAGAELDTSFEPVTLDKVTGQNVMHAGFDTSMRFDVSDAPNQQSVLVVAHGDEAAAKKLLAAPQVTGVFADVAIEPMIICPGSAPMGNTADVARLLCTDRLRAAGMDGSGVLLAIVDTGINAAHLAARGLTPAMDSGRSWVPGAGMVPFNAPVGHGTMCAFDALIAAPRATLLDIQLLRATGAFATAFLSEAIRAYAHLQTVMNAPRRPGESRSLVVNNSWGMFHPSWDFPVGHPGNYSSNPNHPFNRAVAALEAAGADILFAAGNCGADCADGRCQGVVTNAIYGANGHSAVLTIAGVDTSKARVGYSTQGPGRLSLNKPDVCGYTHFSGSGVYAADGGTSAACPVVAGVVAATRSRRPYQPGNPAVSPHAIRDLMRSTAEDLGAAGFDFNTGFGVVSGCRIADRIDPPRLPPERPPVIDFCRRYPHLCYRIPPRLPRLPEPIPIPRPFPLPGPGPRPGFDAQGPDAPGHVSATDIDQLVATAWEMGYRSAQDEAASGGAVPGGGTHKCNCT